MSTLDKVNAGLQAADAALTLVDRLGALNVGSPQTRARRLRSRAAALRTRAAVASTRGNHGRAARLLARATGLDERASIISPTSTL